MKTEKNIEIHNKKKMKRIDYALMMLITFLYAILAFWNLGDKDVPTTYAKLNKKDVIEVEFNKKEKIDSVRFRNGWVENVIYNIKVADTKKGKWNYDSTSKVMEKEEEDCEYIMGYCYTWDFWQLSQEGKYIEIEVVNKDAVVAELVFLDENKNIIQPKSVKVNGKKIEELTDEQQKLELRQTYKNSPYFDEYLYIQSATEYINGLGALEWTHPPLGKCFIALGMKLFGESPFGWRFIGTFCGILMLPLIYIFAKRMFGKTLYPVLACIMLAMDFMHFTQTRIATIDVYVVLFVILMYYFMYLYCEKSADSVKLQETWYYLLGVGVSMGMCIACKWSGVYAAFGLAVIFFVNMFMKKKEYKPYIAKVLLFCIGVFVVLPLVIYILSYIPFKLENYEEASFFEKILINQKQMFSFHSKLEDTNVYESKWYTWPLILKPIMYTSGIVSGTEKYSINAMGNPFIWWAGIIAFIYMIYMVIRKKDKNALYLCIGYVAQYIPWAFVSRMTFIYHYFTCVPFVVLMNVYVIKELMGQNITKKKIIYLSVYMLAIAISFIMFYPVISGMSVNYNYVYEWLRWLKEWILIP